MSTSTSLRSESAGDAPLVLLWNDHWWLPDRTAPVPIPDPEHPHTALLAALPRKPRRLRLLYQPHHLASVSVRCPAGKRRTIGEALAAEYPLLHDPIYAWSYEPVAAVAGQARTVFHHETEPGLYALTAALHSSGVELVAAWPLASALNVLPAEWPDTGAMLVVAATADEALIYRHAPDGSRTVDILTGVARAEQLTGIVTAALARADLALHVVAFDDASRAELQPLVGSLPLAAWPDLARAATLLSPRLTSQLLPGPALVWLNHTLTALAIAACLAFVAVVVDVALGLVDAHDTRSRETAAALSLQSELQPLRERAAEAERLRRDLAALAPGTPVLAPFLEDLTASLPAGVVIVSLDAGGNDFALAGGATDPALPEEAWRAWLAALAQDGRTLQQAPKTPPAAEFSLRGTFRS